MSTTIHKLVPVGADGAVLTFECGSFKPEVIVIDNMTPSNGYLYTGSYSNPLVTKPSPEHFVPAHDFKVLVAPAGVSNFTVAIEAVAAPTGTEFVDVIVSDDPRYFRQFHQTNLPDVSIVGGATEATLATRATEATLLLLKNKDFATQTTLAALLAAAATEATLATRATEATLATRATEATLALLEAKDFATQTTLAALLAAAATETTLASVATKLDTLHADMGTANGLLADIKTNTTP